MFHMHTIATIIPCTNIHQNMIIAPAMTRSNFNSSDEELTFVCITGSFVIPSPQRYTVDIAHKTSGRRMRYHSKICRFSECYTGVLTDRHLFQFQSAMCGLILFICSAMSRSIFSSDGQFFKWRLSAI